LDLIALATNIPKNDCLLTPANATFNGAAYGNCAWVPGSFSNWFDPYILYLVGGPAIILIGVLGLVLYKERAWGRKLRGFTGTVGIGRMAGQDGVIGKIDLLTERLSWFDASYRTGILGLKRKGLKTLIHMMPGGIVKMSQREGGVSFALVDLDRGTTVNPDVEAWAEVAYAEYAETHDAEAFVLNWKLKQIEESQTERFPDPHDVDLDGETEITVPVGAGQLLQMPLYQLVTDPNAMAWWGYARKEEQKRLAETRQTKALIEAILAGADHYVVGEGDKAENFEIVEGMAGDLEEECWRQLANDKGQYAKVLIGGRVITTQYVAGIMKGLASPSQLLGYYKRIKDEVAEDFSGKYSQYAPLFIAAGLAVMFSLIGLAALGVVH
jgi:hypothetical protein